MDDQQRREFYTRTYGFGARTGLVIGIVAILFAFLVRRVTPDEQHLFLQALAVGIVVIIVTRHHRWPAVVVESDAIELNVSLWRKQYRRLTASDIKRMDVMEHSVVIVPHRGKPIKILRKGFPKRDRDALWEALSAWTQTAHMTS